MEGRKYLHILFLVALIALKVSAVHVYFHNCDEEEHMDDCELCEHAIYNQNIEFSTPTQFHSFEIDHTSTFCQLESHYESVCITTFINDTHFGRPPPSLTLGFTKNPSL